MKYNNFDVKCIFSVVRSTPGINTFKIPLGKSIAGTIFFTSHAVWKLFLSHFFIQFKNKNDWFEWVECAATFLYEKVPTINQWPSKSHEQIAICGLVSDHNVNLNTLLHTKIVTSWVKEFSNSNFLQSLSGRKWHFFHNPVQTFRNRSFQKKIKSSEVPFRVNFQLWPIKL